MTIKSVEAGSFAKDDGSFMANGVYTTAEVSKICNVSLTSVVRWTDAGKLPSFRTPGGHRRVREEDLRHFLIKYNIPFRVVPEANAWKILVIGEKEKVTNLLDEILHRSSDIQKILWAKGLYEGAIHVGRELPDLVLVMVGKEGKETLRFLKSLRKIPETKHTKILLLKNSSAEIKEHDFLAAGADAVISKPLLNRVVRTHLLDLLGKSSPRS